MDFAENLMRILELAARRCRTIVMHMPHLMSKWCVQKFVLIISIIIIIYDGILRHRFLNGPSSVSGGLSSV